jgi:2-polyprenyl-3-methyl-5-hydroxy-6-metoxy-1,4-benzoquinol methylase
MPLGEGGSLMDCCQCQGIETRFDRKYVAKKLEKYRESGSKNTTRQLIEALQAEGVAGMTLLDIGGGIGDIQHALLRSGVSFATDNEASSAYLDACRQEAERLGHADRVRHILGNFVEVANDIAPADIVTLDRVICCYHDMPALVNLSTQKARRLYGIVYPLDRWWVRLAMQVYYNCRYWIRRNPMRNFVHPSKEVEAIIQSNGLNRCFYRLMGLWQVVVFSRS